jgi:tRNA-Thr(GGU) m(6)t(6)A37 methyltransferase TsaA
MRPYSVTAVATILGGRCKPIDDDWGAVTATIRFDHERFAVDALMGLEQFSHLEVVYLFHLVDPAGVERGARHPRGNPEWPRAGIFAQRAKDRPNRIGVSRCRLLEVDGLDVRVEGLDAVDGSPVLDVKPHMVQFDARGAVHQPAWATELMAGYWS